MLECLERISAQAAIIDGMREAVQNVELLKKIATDCHDPGHDPRYCETCSSRMDGIEAYQREIAKLLPPSPTETT